MKSSLLSEFLKNDKSAWKLKVEKELKNRTYEDLLYHPAKDVSMEPYYVNSELPDTEIGSEIQFSQRQDADWLTLPSLSFGTPARLNQDIQDQLAKGADGVWLNCGDISLSHMELPKTLHTIRQTDTPVFLESSESPVAIINELSQGSGYYLKGGIVYDPIANWMRTGKSLNSAFVSISEGLAFTKMMREFRSYKVESHVFHESGADVVQELAFTISSFVTYLDQLTDLGISPLMAANRMLFSISISPDFLTEIAKLRALRYLYRQITRAYGLPDDLCQATIQCRNSRLFRSTHSPYTNQIRSSSEAMSAVIGGCDALTIEPFDAFFAEPSVFSDRIARNVSLLLKHESYLNRVADPAAGSYYLELLTQKLAVAAWDKFLAIEDQGGLLEAFKENLIQEEINNSWNNMVSSFHNGRVLVGVNKFRDGENGTMETSIAGNEDLSPSSEYGLLTPKNLDKIL